MKIPIQPVWFSTLKKVNWEPERRQPTGQQMTTGGSIAVLAPQDCCKALREVNGRTSPNNRLAEYCVASNANPKIRAVVTLGIIIVFRGNWNQMKPIPRIPIQVRRQYHSSNPQSKCGDCQWLEHTDGRVVTWCCVEKYSFTLPEVSTSIVVVVVETDFNPWQVDRSYSTHGNYTELLLLVLCLLGRGVVCESPPQVPRPSLMTTTACLLLVTLSEVWGKELTSGRDLAPVPALWACCLFFCMM